MNCSWHWNCDRCSYFLSRKRRLSSLSLPGDGCRLALKGAGGALQEAEVLCPDPGSFGEEDIQSAKVVLCHFQKFQINFKNKTQTEKTTPDC